MQPELLVVGGPNGSGKTTFAKRYVTITGRAYLGADEIAFALSPNNVGAVRIEAGEIFLHDLQRYIANGESFVVETTLSGLSFRRSLEAAVARGYQIEIVHFFLDSGRLYRAGRRAGA